MSEMETDDDMGDLPEVALSLKEFVMPDAEEIRKYREADEEMNEGLRNLRLQLDAEEHEQEEEDKTYEFMRKKLKKLDVQEPTYLLGPPLSSFLDSDQNCSIFNHESIETGLSNFFVNTEIPLPLKIIVDFGLVEKFILQRTLQMICEVNPFDPKSHKGLGRYVFFWMSVFPDEEVVEGCYNFLLDSNFQATFSDIVTVFCNWGTTFEALFHSIPCDYELPLPLQNIASQERGKKIPHFCFTKVFEYLSFVFNELKLMPSASLLLEPILQIAMDRNVPIRLKYSMCKFVESLSTCELEQMLKKLHFETMSLPAKVFLCTNILEHTPLGFPLTYATLQDFVGVQDVVYKVDVSLTEIFELCYEKEAVIFRAEYCDLESIVHLLYFWVWKQLDTRVNKDDTVYIDLLQNFLNNLSWHLRADDPAFLSGPDPALLKEVIKRKKHELQKLVPLTFLRFNDF